MRTAPRMWDVLPPAWYAEPHGNGVGTLTRASIRRVVRQRVEARWDGRHPQAEPWSISEMMGAERTSDARPSPEDYAGPSALSVRFTGGDALERQQDDAQQSRARRVPTVPARLVPMGESERAHQGDYTFSLVDAQGLAHPVMTLSPTRAQRHATAALRRYRSATEPHYGERKRAASVSRARRTAQRSAMLEALERGRAERAAAQGALATSAAGWDQDN
jgi:hypothetical protein